MLKKDSNRHVLVLGNGSLLNVTLTRPPSKALHSSRTFSFASLWVCESIFFCSSCLKLAKRLFRKSQKPLSYLHAIVAPPASTTLILVFQRRQSNFLDTTCAPGAQPRENYDQLSPSYLLFRSNQLAMPPGTLIES